MDTIFKSEEIEQLAQLIQKGFQSQAEYMDRRFADVDQRFEDVDRRFDAVDQRFAAMDQRFDAIDRRFDAMDQKFGVMAEKLDLHDRTMHSRDEFAAEEIGVLKKRVAAIEHHLGMARA